MTNSPEITQCPNFHDLGNLDLVAQVALHPMANNLTQKEICVRGDFSDCNIQFLRTHTECPKWRQSQK